MDRDATTYGCRQCVDRHKKRVGRVFGTRRTYRTVVVDPPWPYEEGRPGWSWRDGAPSGKARSFDYDFLSPAQIADLPVAELSERDAHLYLWTTQRYLRDAFWVVEAWGFSTSSVLVWCKEPRGFNVGGSFASTTEFVLFARRGNLAANGSVEREWFEWPRSGHSAKPEAFLDLVESVSPGPYLELFARRNRLGWDTWGNEALEHVEMVV